MLGPYLLTRTLSYDFQGQEAPVSIVSLTHSDFDDDSAAAAVAGGGAHGMPFVLNANRLNVALSRAQCLAIVVASPQLTQAPSYVENKLAQPSAIWLSEGLQRQITWLRLGLPGAAAGLGLSAAWAALTSHIGLGLHAGAGAHARAATAAQLSLQSGRGRLTG